MEQVTCACCGEKRQKQTMIRRRLNGRERYCCSLRCEVRWEKINLLGVCG